MFLNNSDPYDSGKNLPAFLSRIALKLHNILVTPKLVEKVINALSSSSLNGILVVVPKKSGPELLYILAAIFNICLKESCFPYYWKTLFWLLVLENIEEKSTAKSDCQVNPLFVVTKSLTNLSITGLFFISKNVAFFLISSLV